MCPSKAGRIHRRIGQAARARDFGSARFPLQRRPLRHRLYRGGAAVGDQLHHRSEEVCLLGGSAGFAQQLLHQRKKQERKNHVQRSRCQRKIRNH